MKLLKKVKHIFDGREAKNAGWIIAGKVIQMVLSFVVSVYSVRFLGPANYGVLNYAIAYVTFFASICTLGIGSVIIKNFTDYPDEHGETLGTAMILRAVSSVLSAFMIVGIVLIVDRGEPITIIVTALSTLSLLFQVPDTLRFWFQAQYRSKIYSIATLIAYVVSSAYKIALLALGMGVEWFALATSIDYLFVSAALMLAYWRNKGTRLTFSFSKSKQLLKESYHYIISGTMMALYAQADKFMLKHMLDEIAVGYYSLASSVSTMWVFVLTAIVESLYPTIISSYKTDKAQFVRKSKILYALIIYISAFVAIMFTIFGKVAVQIVYGKEYLSAVGSLIILSWYVIFSHLSLAKNSWVVCEGKQKYLKYIYFFSLIIKVIMNAVFIPIWGATGAAVASLITQIFSTIIIPWIITDMRENTIMILESFILKGIFR